MILKFCYSTKIDFSEPVTNHRFTLKCTPIDRATQKIERLSHCVTPDDNLSFGKDAFGNAVIVGHTDGEHSQFQAVVEGVIRTNDVCREKTADRHKLGIYRYQSPYTMMGENLEKYYRLIQADALNDYDRGIKYMHDVYDVMTYEKNVTDYATTAEEAMRLCRGVCQDYAHILIALLRNAGIPARYVVGMMKGEGYSHAWVEMAVDGYWYGLDPTNNQTVGAEYIKISNGRDYNDCIVNRGIFTGQVTQTQEVSVVVTQLQGL